MTERETPISPNIARKLADAPPHVLAGLDAYRAALRKRQDWHRAVRAAIDAAVAVLNGEVG